MTWNNLLNNYEKDPAVDIAAVKAMYDAQVHKVEREEYIKNLLFADYVRQIKMNLSKYDYMEDIFNAAQSQLDKTKKKEREQLTTIEDFIKQDFFGSDYYNFKLTNITRGGYETYYWSVEFEGYGRTVAIIIPVKAHLSIKNIQLAYDGMFAFSVKESESTWSVKIKSYDIKSVADYIKGYLGRS